MGMKPHIQAAKSALGQKVKSKGFDFGQYESKEEMINEKHMVISAYDLNGALIANVTVEV